MRLGQLLKKYPVRLMRPGRVSYPVVLFTLLALLVMGPLLLPGYVLHYDMLFSPHFDLSLQSIREGIAFYHALPRNTVLAILSNLFPMDIIQKLLLLGMLFLGMYSAYKTLPAQSTLARSVTGLFYGLNPFVYDRFMAGHWLFLFGYALTPFIVRSWCAFLREPDLKNFYKALLWWLLITFLSVHHIVILGLLFVVLTLFFVRAHRELLWSGAMLAVMFFVHVWWVVPALVLPNISQAVGIEHLHAFATSTDLQYGLLFNMLALQGFWYDGWLSIKDLFGGWPLLVVIWLAPIFASGGLIRYFQPHQRRLSLSLAVAAALALIFAAGPVAPVAEINSWLFSNIPGLAVMREPHKFLALLALAYAVLLGLGLNLLIIRHKKQWIAYAAAISICLVALPIFWAGHNQLTTTHYPESWHRFYRHLEESGENPGTVVILPWDVYVEDTFVDNLVAHPARHFFGRYAIVSPHMRLDGIKDWVPPALTELDSAIERKDNVKLREAMQNIGANYILLANSKDSGSYGWIQDVSKKKTVVDTPDLLVLKLETD